MITAFFVFAIGACVGSFCSVLLHRLRFGGSVVAGRSECTSCKHKLGPIDLIPIVSWIISRGKCRYCHAPFSWQYLALEVFFGVMFVVSYFRYCCFGDFCSDGSCFILAARLFSFLVFLGLVFIYDARHGEIPDAFSITGTIFALIVNIFVSPSAWYWYLAAAAVGAGFYGIQYAISRGKWVGDGDIIMGAMMGAMVGWPNIFYSLLFAYVIGLVVVLVLMVLKRKRMTDTIPMGPLLAIGTAIMLLVPVSSISQFWYALIF